MVLAVLNISECQEVVALSTEIETRRCNPSEVQSYSHYIKDIRKIRFGIQRRTRCKLRAGASPAYLSKPSLAHTVRRRMTGLLDNEPQRKSNEGARSEVLKKGCCLLGYVIVKSAISLLMFRRNMLHPSSGYPEHTSSHSGSQ